MENMNPQVMRHVGKEIQHMMSEPMEGIHVIINDKDVTEIQAVIEGPAETPYAGGKFRVKLCIGKDFPNTPPKGYFLTKIFHPNVSSNGEICVNTLKKDWKSDLGIRHVLLTIKCLLIVPNPESALNEEAGKLLLERYDDYCARARLYTEIHAQSAKGSENCGSSGNTSEEQSSKKSASVASSSSSSKVVTKKDKNIKDKKKTLKRL